MEKCLRFKIFIACIGITLLVLIVLLYITIRQVNDFHTEASQLVLQQAIDRFSVLFFYSMACMAILLALSFLLIIQLRPSTSKNFNDAFYRDLVTAVPDAILVIDEKSNIVFNNRQAEMLFNYNKGQLIDLNVRSLVKHDALFTGTNNRTEILAIKNDGALFHAEIASSSIKSGKDKLVIIFIHDVSAQHEYAEKLRKSEAFFRVLVSSVEDYAIFTLDVNGKVASWNSGAEHIKGYTEKEILGRSFEVFYSKIDVQKREPWRNLEMAARHGHFENEGWRFRKDGSRFWASIVFTALKDKDGILYGYSKITRDITERRHHQEQLEFLSLQIEQSNDAIYTVTADRILQSWNRGAEKLYGYTKEEVLGKDSFRLLNADMSETQLLETMQEINKKGYWTGEIKRLTKSGEEIYVRSSTSVVKDSLGNIAGYITSGFDVTGQKKLLREITHLASIVEQTSEAIFSRGEDRRIISWNNGAEQLFGYTKHEAIGSRAEELGIIHLTSQQISVIENRITETLEWKSEMTYYHKNGSTFYGAVTANPIINEKGAVVAFNFIVKDISMRKQLEEQLKISNDVLEKRVAERTAEIYKNERRFRALVENNYDMISLIDASSKVTYRSPSVTRVLGFEPHEMETQEGIESIYPDDREYAQQIFCEAVSKPGKPIKALFRRRHANGHYIWLEGVVTNLLNEEQVNAIVSNFRDVTEQKLSAEKLAASETKFRLLIENSTEAIALTDAASVNIYRSPAAQKIIGHNLQKDTIGLTHPEDLAALKNIREQVISHPGIPVPFQARFQHAKGHYIWLEGTFINLLQVDGVNAVVANYRDITNRKELEQLLHEANKLARIGGWEADLVKHTVFWTDITREIHESEPGFIPDLSKGVGFYKEGKSRDLITAKVKEAIEEGKSWDVELQIITAKNNERWIRSIGEAEVVEGKCIRLYGSFQDIDQRKKAEEKIKKLNTELEERVVLRTAELKKINEELEAFSYSVSHDLRAPLRAISGFTSKLEDKYSNQLDDEAKRITAVIKDNTLKMGHLIDDLLHFSRIGRHEFNRIPIDNDYIVNEIIGGIKNSAVPSVEWVVHPLKAVSGDLNTIRQVWVNLITNAVKYSSKTEAPKIEIGSYEDGAEVVFYVKDNGIGFNEKYKDKLFKVFQRLHSAAEFEGTGIGLAIVERVISKHGGRVWANAVINEGACFNFSLPSHQQGLLSSSPEKT